jgi:ketosteroid isomerase-like protein
VKSSWPGIRARLGLGSTQGSSNNEGSGRLAQLGERLPYKQEVTGSSPVPPIVAQPAKTEPTVIERLFAAVREGDPGKVLALLHSKVEWTPTAWSGESMYRGHEGVHLWLDQFGEAIEHLNIHVEKAETREDRGAILGIVFDTRWKQKFSVKVAWSYEMEQGLLRRGRAHDTWEQALESAGLTSTARR